MMIIMMITLIKKENAWARMPSKERSIASFFGRAALFDGHQNDGHLHLDIRPNMYCVHYVMFTQGNEPPISTQFSFLIFMTEIAHNHNHQESSSRSLNRHHHDYLSILFLLDHVVKRLLCWRRWVFPTERTIFLYTYLSYHYCFPFI